MLTLGMFYFNIEPDLKVQTHVSSHCLILSAEYEVHTSQWSRIF